VFKFGIIYLIAMELENIQKFKKYTFVFEEEKKRIQR
jgi:hypothetical protein